VCRRNKDQSNGGCLATIEYRKSMVRVRMAGKTV